MSTVTLRIAVDKAGASENIGAVKRDLQGMGETGAQAGQQAAGGVNGLSSAINGAKTAIGAFLAVYAGIQALSGVVRLADEYQGLSDRLRLATAESGTFEAAQAGVFAIAQQTGTALSAVGGLYVSLTNSTKALGLSQGELQTITQAVTQSFIVSGASAQQTDAAIRQLGQGFASGVLRGDEFNSMMENAPSLAAALAASLGVTTGELRAMAAEGKLTSDVLAQGLLQQAPAIAEQFGQMGTTVGRAFTQLSNAVLKFVGEASQSTGAASSLAAAITAVANNIDTLARALGAAGVAVGVFIGARGVAALVGAFQAAATSIALSAAPIGAFITGATGAAAATSAWAIAGRALFTLMGGWIGIAAAAAAGIYYLATAQTEAEKTAEAADAAITNLKTATGELRPAALSAASATLKLAEAQLESAYAALAAAEAYSRSAAGSLQYAGNLAGQARSAQGARDEVNLLANSVLRLRAEIASGGDFTIIKRAAIDLLEDANSITKAFGFSIGETTRATSQAIPPAARLTEVVRSQAVATTEAKKAVDLHKQAVDAIRGSTIAYTSGLGTAVSALANVTTATDTTRGAVDGFGDAIDQSVIDAENWARYWEGATDAVLDAFGGLFSGGIDSLEEFGDQMLQISQRIVSDIVKEFARTGQIRLPTGMFGAGGTGSTVGGWLSAIGTAYGALQNARNGGSALSTIGGFAVSGAQIAGPVGAAVGAIVGGLVAAFSGDNNPLLRVRSSEFSGPRRSEGRATSQLGNIFIRTENTPDGAGTSPEIAQRIADFDNLIASFLSADQLSAIRGALSNVNDTFENGAFTIENALNSRFGTILGALDSNIQEFVGTTGTLEQRVARLTDALTIASIAASDNGISSSFDDLATLFTRFRLQGEGVSDTFQRLSFGAGLIDDTLLMLGGTFNGTRLQAATFAGELIELAGGLDQFSARLNGALEALFTEPERNQFLASQAQAALNESLRGLNISGTGVDSIREQLRTQLRDALAAGNSALVNELLIAGNALGAFTTAVGRLGDEATGALSGVVLGGTSGTIRPGGGLTSPAGTAAQTQIQAVQTTNTILQTQTSILQQIAINTTRGTGLTPGASPKAGGDATAVLVQIKGLIEQAVRTQVTEALKRTTGANKRAATA